MRKLNDRFCPPSDLVLGICLNQRVPEKDQRRQRMEVEEILRRLGRQPGVILADEVGMGKTYVALAVAYSVAMKNPRGPVVVMVPANLVAKWEQDLKTFCELYINNRCPVIKGGVKDNKTPAEHILRYGVARNSVELMKLLDDPPRERCQLVFLAHGAMGRKQSDKWVRLALIAEALRRHARGKADKLIRVKAQIHRFLGELINAVGEQRAQDWGNEVWRILLRTDPMAWRGLYNQSVRNEKWRLDDDPVPKAFLRSLQQLDLSELADKLKEMPIRAHGGEKRVSERINLVRNELRGVEQDLWKGLLAHARWRSPLLVMDEAHHLKNSRTALARQLQSPDLERDLKTGDGAFAGKFDRMLFLTATPFQLGHHELVRVLERFGDVRRDEAELGGKEEFKAKLANLGSTLTESQRSAMALQRSWSRLRPEDSAGNVEDWWNELLGAKKDSLTRHQQAAVDAFKKAKRYRDAATEALRPWIVRHNKGKRWSDTSITRREKLDGAAIFEITAKRGLPIPNNQLLPFFLAARSAVSAGQDLLGAALCSSYEAFRLTRQDRIAATDEEEAEADTTVELSHAEWYLEEFDQALKHCSGGMHPKVEATVRKAVDLWEKGEKVLVFAFYRHTCRALRIHIGREIERRIETTGRRRLREAGLEDRGETLSRRLGRVQERFFDNPESPGRRALDAELAKIVKSLKIQLEAAHVDVQQQEEIIEVMRRFLRVHSTLVRCFPLAELDTLKPAEAVARLLDYADSSSASWRHKFLSFICFLTEGCSSVERTLYLEAGKTTRTGKIRVELDEEDPAEPGTRTSTIANVQVATGSTKRDTRERLMRAFNTPFFPDIFVCSQVMGEGVDLQRFCRHVIHHDLDWNPSTIEQRTGRIDRLGCKAEGKHPILVYLPYLAGTADERQYRVMSEREQWFRVVMGQDEVARLITPDTDLAVPLPAGISDALSFELGLGQVR